MIIIIHKITGEEAVIRIIIHKITGITILHGRYRADGSTSPILSA